MQPLAARTAERRHSPTAITTGIEIARVARHGITLFVSATLFVGCMSISDPDGRSTENSRPPNGPILPLTYDPTSGGEEQRTSDAPATTTPRKGAESRHPASVAAHGERSPIVQIQPAGDRTSRGASERSVIDVRPIDGAARPSDPSDSELQVDPLIDVQRRTLATLDSLIRPSRPLRIHQQLTMEGLIVTLLALHDLEVGNIDDYRGPLMTAIETLDDPRPGIRHRIAAFYHDLGLDDLAEKLMVTVVQTDAASEDADPDDSEEVFQISSLIPEKTVRDGEEREFDLNDLLPKDQLHLLADLEGITARPSGNGVQYKFSVEAFLYDENDSYLEQQRLEKNKTEYVPHEMSVIRINYVIPSRFNPGNYRLELKITDEFSNQQDLASIPIRIGRR
ncbi:MAG: hypothetical protein AAF488_04915 [Planctomycetota bacterium]